MELLLPKTGNKEAIFTAVGEYLAGISLRASAIDAERPWGGFYVIDETQTKDFIARYFPDYPAEEIEKGGKLSPKILVVGPGKRLSWQLHHRREELWKNIGGPVGYVTSMTDEQGPVQQLNTGETVQFATEVRHRLVGLSDWGVIAEIWQHTDPNNPSDESDIVRVEDDFGR